MYTYEYAYVPTKIVALPRILSRSELFDSYFVKCENIRYYE